MQKPSLTILYGQPDNRSTSYQTTQLAKALQPWLTTIPFKVKAMTKYKWSRHADRIFSNYFKPLFQQPNTDYVLYCNDGSADLSHWQAKKIIYWYDAYCDWSETPPHRWEWIHWLRYRNIITADYVFAVSHIQVKIARNLRPGREDTVIYMPVGVNCQFFDPAYAEPKRIFQQFNLPKKTIVGYLGYLGIRGSTFAGQPLLEVAPELLKEQNVHFLIVGFGQALPLFKQRVNDLNLSNHFTFTGYVDDELLPHCIAAMDICVDTLEEGIHSEARSETKLKQYMSMGRACVATAIGENRIDLDHGRAGVLVKPGNTNLIQGIKTLCERPELRTELGKIARQRAESIYDWSKLAERIVDALALK
jgi:glycosyltransferase involved in cell wall biosynthesis